MQIADTFSKSGLPPSIGGGLPPADIASQLRLQKRNHRRVLVRRAIRTRWLPVFLVVLGSVLAITLAQTIGFSYPLIAFAPLLGLPFLVLIIKRTDIGLLV